MISMEKGLLLDRRMRALTGLDGPAFLKLEKRFTRVLTQAVALHTRGPAKRASAPPEPGPKAHHSPGCPSNRGNSKIARSNSFLSRPAYCGSSFSCSSKDMPRLKLANRANCMIFISGYANDLYKKFLTRENGWSQKAIETTTRNSSGQSYKRVPTSSEDQ